MFDAKSKDYLQILVQPVAITVVATQLALLLPPAGMKMKSPKKRKEYSLSLIFKINTGNNQQRTCSSHCTPNHRGSSE